MPSGRSHADCSRLHPIDGEDRFMKVVVWKSPRLLTPLLKKLFRMEKGTSDR